jgi:endoglucanase
VNPLHKLMRFAWHHALTLCLASGTYQVAQGATSADCAAVSTATCEVAHALGKGVNMGNMLEAPNEGDWLVRLDPAYVPVVAQHFKTVRLPVRWSNHAAATADATLDEFFAKRVDRAIDAFLEQGLYVIINVQHYNQLNGQKLNYKEFEVAPEVLETRFLNIWKQVAERYKDKSSKLIFEILNEPTGNYEGNAWPVLMGKALQTIRAQNPGRIVMVAPSGNRVKSLKDLRPPKDANIIVAFHNYEPFPFTHQGLNYMPWFPKGVSCCDAKQLKLAKAEFDEAINWSRQVGVPLHLGEFGVHQQADTPSRVNYVRMVRSFVEPNLIGWTYWELASSFGVFSSKQGWNQDMKSALLN